MHLIIKVAEQIIEQITVRATQKNMRRKGIDSSQQSKTLEE
jgi:hypothetical protein